MNDVLFFISGSHILLTGRAHTHHISSLSSSSQPPSTSSSSTIHLGCFNRYACGFCEICSAPSSQETIETWLKALVKIRVIYMPGGAAVVFKCECACVCVINATCEKNSFEVLFLLIVNWWLRVGVCVCQFMHRNISFEKSVKSEVSGARPNMPGMSCWNCNLERKKEMLELSTNFQLSKSLLSLLEKWSTADSAYDVCGGVV